ncbi:MAG: MBOAT family protein [Clostridia bacterium]|nr:MBOAT family protein [Clostridia bacterium]
MTFNSIPFLIFYPCVLLGYFGSRRLPEKIGAQVRWIFLLLASYFFYMYSQPALIVLILFTTVVSWVSSLLIERLNARIAAGDLSEREAKRAVRQKKLYLTLTLITSLGVLFFFKYFIFLCETVFGIVGLFTGQAYQVNLNLILPVGISFYTFQTLSYAIDVYRGSIRAERHFGYYALFVSFFPQLVAGPIERPANLLPQLRTRLPVTREDVGYGLRKMMLGFFKKIAVADLLSVYVNAIYNNLDGMGTVPALGVILSTLLFAVQIYCDFSGYTDIAIGCARVMGIRLMKNFDRPYTAKTIREFWGRWHISLSSWFRDYLYIPLGGSRCAKWRHLLNICIVFLVSGLWHGAAWTFVIWGGLHAVYQVIGILTLGPRNRLLGKIGLSPDGKLVGALRTFNTFLLVDFAWLFFRANSFADLRKLLAALFSPASWKVPFANVVSLMGLSASGALLTVVSLVLLVFLDRLIRHHDEPAGNGALVRRGAFIAVTWMIVFAWMFLSANDLTSTFIYFQF